MEFLGEFILAFAAASIGFLIHRIVGFNIYGFISAIPLIFIMIPFVLLTISAPSLTTSELISNLNFYLTNFTKFLPSLIIGHVAGAMASALFGRCGVFNNYQFR